MGGLKLRFFLEIRYVAWYVSPKCLFIVTILSWNIVLSLWSVADHGSWERIHLTLVDQFIVTLRKPGVAKGLGSFFGIR